MSFKEADLAQNQHNYEKSLLRGKKAKSTEELRKQRNQHWGDRGSVVLYGRVFQKSIQQIIHSVLKQWAHGASLGREPISPSLSLCPAGDDPSDIVWMTCCVLAQAGIPWCLWSHPVLPRRGRSTTKTLPVDLHFPATAASAGQGEGEDWAVESRWTSVLPGSGAAVWEVGRERWLLQWKTSGIGWAGCKYCSQKEGREQAPGHKEREKISLQEHPITHIHSLACQDWVSS